MHYYHTQKKSEHLLHIFQHFIFFEKQNIFASSEKNVFGVRLNSFKANFLKKTFSFRDQKALTLVQYLQAFLLNY